MTDSPPLVHPTPRRPLPLPLPRSPASAESSAARITPTREKSDLLSGQDQEPAEIDPASSTGSFLNLTSSTLLGIYSPSGYDSLRGDPSTPWGTGTHTPLRMASMEKERPIILPKSDAFSRPRASGKSFQPKFWFRNTLLPVLERTILLFLFGVGYGLIITHLHDKQRLAPVPVDRIDRSSWRYLILWGIVGICIGELLPWVDAFWNETMYKNKDSAPSTASSKNLRPSSSTSDEDERLTTNFMNGVVADWSSVVRGIGAFIGIAFAIRKLPWHSTLQASLTLALVNPVLWYLIDRSKPGFILSSFVGIVGTTVLIWMNPETGPLASASPHSSATADAFKAVENHRLIDTESIGVWTWIASVLFCSSVCFGNIGRRLATGP